MTKQVRSLVSWSIPQQSVTHPGDRFSTCEFDQAAVKVGFWTNWTACWVSHSTSKRSLHITLTHYILCTTQSLCSEPWPYLHVFKTKWKITSPATKPKCFFPVKIYKNSWFISFLKSSAHYITSQSANFFVLFLLLFSFPLILPAELWTAWTWIKTIPKQPRSLSWCHVSLITSC